MTSTMKTGHLPDVARAGNENNTGTAMDDVAIENRDATARRPDCPVCVTAVPAPASRELTGVRRG